MDNITYRRGALEAIFIVVSQPIPTENLAQTIDATVDETHELLTTMAADYAKQAHGFHLREVAGGWRFYSDPRYADIVRDFVTAGHTNNLSVPALETLAVIAYRQPVTRAQVAAIRGVDVDSVVRTLQNRGLVTPAGTTSDTGAVLYETTDLFLEKMGMNSLAELAPLAPYLPEGEEFDDVVKEME